MTDDSALPAPPGAVSQWLLDWGRSATVEREWAFARAWRYEAIEGKGPSSE